MHSESSHQLNANISHFKVIDEDGKKVASEATDIRIRKPTVNCNTGKMCIPEIFNSLLGADGLLTGQSKLQIQTCYNVIHILQFQVTGFPEQCLWQITLPVFHYLINWEPSCHRLANVGSFITLFKLKNRCFAPPRSIV